MDEVCGRLEVGAHVEGRRVMGLDPQVADAQCLVGVRRAPPPAVRGVEDVGDPQAAELPPVVRYVPVRRRGYWWWRRATLVSGPPAAGI